MKKQCNKCLINKTVSEFFKDKNCTSGYYSICKQCKTAATLKWRAKNREEYNSKMRAYQASNKEARRNCDYKRKYGITLAEYNALSEKQDHKCAICQKPNKSTKRVFALDHSHSTGKARGILCFGCNRALHTLEHDGLLEKAKAYLELYN